MRLRTLIAPGLLALPSCRVSPDETRPSAPSITAEPAQESATSSILPPPEMVLVPGGTIHQGEHPEFTATAEATRAPRPPPEIVHHVSSFFIDRTETTRAQYQRFLLATAYRPPHVEQRWADEGWNWDGTDYPLGTGEHPVVLTNWYDAKAYCQWSGKRLPTEAEWQLAALGASPDERNYPWGDEYNPTALNHGRDDHDCFDDSDGWERTSPVGSFPSGASAIGALDMYGNAWEWTADVRQGDWNACSGLQNEQEAQDMRCDPPGLYVVVRGGSFCFDLSRFTAGERHAFLPEFRRKTSGFRCARDLEPPGSAAQ